MKTLLFIVLAIIAIVYTGNPKISFSPFSITFEKPYLPFATLCLIGATVLYSLQYDKLGYERGVKDALEVVREVLNEDAEKL